MTSKLATFRTDSDIWQKFQDKAKTKGTNASALLQNFVQNYLDDNLDSIDKQSRQTDNSIDINLDERIDTALEAKVDFSIRNISRVADEHYERLVAVVAQNKTDIDTRIDDKFSDIQNELTQRDREIEALKLELENIKTAIATCKNDDSSEATASPKKSLRQLAQKEAIAA